MALDLRLVIDRSIEEVSFVDHSLVRRKRTVTLNARQAATCDGLELLPLAIVGRSSGDILTIRDPSGRSVAQVSESRERTIVQTALNEIFDIAVLEEFDEMTEIGSDSSSRVFECRDRVRREIANSLLAVHASEVLETAVEERILTCVPDDLRGLVDRAAELAPLVAFFAHNSLVLVEISSSDASATSVFEVSHVEPVIFGLDDWMASLRRQLRIDLRGSAAAASYSLTVIPPRDVLIAEFRASSPSSASNVVSIDRRPGRPTMQLRGAASDEEAKIEVLATLVPRATGMLRALPTAFAATCLISAVLAAVVPNSSEPGHTVAIALLVLPVIATVMIAGMTGTDPHPLAVRLLLYPRLFTWALSSLTMSLLAVSLTADSHQTVRLGLSTICAVYLGAALHIGWMANRVHGYTRVAPVTLRRLRSLFRPSLSADELLQIERGRSPR